jgi:hypothetical protein
VRWSVPGVPDAAVVLGAADKDADGFVMVAAPKGVVDEGDVEVEFSGVFGLELSSLQFDDNVAR